MADFGDFYNDSYTKPAFDFSFTISDETKAYFKELSGKLGQTLGGFSQKFASSQSRIGSDIRNVSGDLSKVLTGFSGGLEAGLANVGIMVLDKLKDVLVGAIEELDTLLNFSRLSQSDTRSLMLGYGFSSSEAYGFSKAMGALGFESDEDLMYASPEEMNMFRNAFTKYTEKYSELYDKGFFDSMLKYQVERNEFEEDIKLEVTQFLVNNKDLIKAGMEAILELTRAVLNIMSVFSGNVKGTDVKSSALVANSSSIINQYRTGTVVNMSNTFNNMTEAEKNFYQESTGSLVTLLAQMRNH